MYNNCVTLYVYCLLDVYTVKILLRNIGALILSAVILIVTSGFTIFHHTCQSSQTSELSLIIPELSCADIKSQETNNEHSCCSVPEIPVEKHSNEDDNCCNTESFLVKLDITFVLVEVDEKTELPVKEHLILFDNEQSRCPRIENSVTIISNDLPPPLGSKALHIFLHQINIPYPSV